MKKIFDTKRLVVISMLCAIAYLCTFFFKFKVAFLTFDFKDAVIAITALIYGPIYGLISAATVGFLELVTISDTGIYGLIMNVLASATFALTCGTVYRYKRTFAGAILGVCFSVVTVTAIMLLANIFITPFYMGVDRTEVVALIPKLLLPFNLCKSILNAAVTLLLYKPVTGALRHIGLMRTACVVEYRINLKTILLWVCTIVVIVVAVLFLVLDLHGSFEWI